MRQWLRTFLREQRAQDLTEYSLLVCFLALIVIASLFSAGTSLNLIYSDASAKVGGTAHGGSGSGDGSTGGGGGSSTGSAGTPGSGGGSGAGTGSGGSGGGTGSGGQAGNDDPDEGSIGVDPP